MARRGAVTISGNNASRVFQVDANVTASISGLTITDGNPTGGSDGGGLLNDGTVTLTNCTFSNNSATDGGGGLWNSATATLTNVTFSGNTCDFGGGGLDNIGGAATLTDCTVSGNSGNGGYGGGLAIDGGTLTLSDCTVSGNSANRGGGLVEYNAASGTLTLTNTTISGNSALRGGGLEQKGDTATLTNCTVSGNDAEAQSGGGLYNLAGSLTLTNCTISGNSAASGDGGGLISGGTVTLGNTIVATNTAGLADPDVEGSVASEGYNLIGKTDGSSGWVASDLTGTIASPKNPLLGTLGNNGGPTQTMALLTGSPAIDAGSNSITGLTIPTTDQRGALRGPAGLNAGSTVDIGAYEASSSYLVTSTADSSDVGTLRAAVGWANVSTNANPANSPTAPNTIVFNTAGVFGTPQTITLTSGQLTLSNTSTAETITGPTAGVIVSGGGSSRVFAVDASVTASTPAASSRSIAASPPRSQG